MADEVARNDDEIGLARVGHRDGVVLNGHGRHAADVKVGEVRDPQTLEVLEKALRARKPPNAELSGCVVPRITLAQELLSKPAESFDGGVSTHVYFTLITWLSARTIVAWTAYGSASKRVRRGLAAFACDRATARRHRRRPLRRSNLPRFPAKAS